MQLTTCTQGLRRGARLAENTNAIAQRHPQTRTLIQSMNNAGGSVKNAGAKKRKSAEKRKRRGSGNVGDLRAMTMPTRTASPMEEGEGARVKVKVNRAVLVQVERHRHRPDPKKVTGLRNLLSPWSLPPSRKIICLPPTSYPRAKTGRSYLLLQISTTATTIARTKM